MTFHLDLRHGRAGYEFVCGWCGRIFLNARELVVHVCEQRKQDAS